MSWNMCVATKFVLVQGSILSVLGTVIGNSELRILLKERLIHEANYTPGNIFFKIKTYN